MAELRVRVQFYSYFKELTGCPTAEVSLPAGSTIQDLLDQLYAQHPKLRPMNRSTLVAVGVEYQGPNYPLKEGDEISLFPPVQGG